jgi:hypothetical protein
VPRIFIALKNPSLWPGFEPATFGSSGQHTNHYTTKATSVHLVYKIKVSLQEFFYFCFNPLLQFHARGPVLSGTP